ncbi:MAG: hypothetical protein JO275_03105, partial [Verrucomicrobia bacterium]|nr:hypothetical protein [Verrucomicrobiota bacterium]
MRSVVESEGAPAAFAKVTLQEKEATIALGGTWNLKGSVRPKSAAALHEVESAGGITRVCCVGQDLGTWDSSLLLFLSEVDEWCQAHQVALDLNDLPEGVGSLIALAKAVPEAETKSGRAGHVSLLYQLGAWAIGQAGAFTAAAAFIGECVLSLRRIFTGKGKVDWRLFWLTMQESGAQALPI